MKNKIIKYINEVRNSILVLEIYAAIKQFYQKTLETNSAIKQQFLQFLPFLVASLITGFIAFIYSKVFQLAEYYSTSLYKQNQLYIFFLTPICFLVSWWTVKKYAPYAKGSGIPQVMAAIELANPTHKQLVKHFISIKIIIIKIISSTIKVLGGGISGREGPTIQISSSIFNAVNAILPKWWKPISQQNVLIAGAAAGLASAFNTPLGGIIFAIEELSKFPIKHYKSPLFTAVIIAGLTAQGLTGPYLYLGYPKTNTSGSLVFLGIILTTIIAGFFSSLMAVYLLKFIKFINSIRNIFQQAGIIIGCALFMATSIYFIGTEAMGSGKEIMERALFTDNKTVEWYLPFSRMIGLIVSFGFGGAGGVFAPSLSSGACFGAIISEFLHLTNGNANLLILVGMAAFLTGVTRAPFTSTIIIFEMTDRHSIIFFLLMSALLANTVASFIDKHSFYDKLKEIYIKEVTT